MYSSYYHKILYLICYKAYKKKWNFNINIDDYNKCCYFFLYFCRSSFFVSPRLPTAFTCDKQTRQLLIPRNLFRFFFFFAGYCSSQWTVSWMLSLTFRCVCSSNSYIFGQRLAFDGWYVLNENTSILTPRPSRRPNNLTRAMVLRARLISKTLFRSLYHFHSLPLALSLSLAISVSHSLSLSHFAVVISRLPTKRVFLPLFFFYMLCFSFVHPFRIVVAIYCNSL